MKSKLLEEWWARQGLGVFSEINGLDSQTLLFVAGLLSTLAKESTAPVLAGTAEILRQENANEGTEDYSEADGFARELLREVRPINWTALRKLRRCA